MSGQLTRSKLLTMSEAELRESVLIPLFESMGYSDVRENHGSSELGKDIVMWKSGDLGNRTNYAVVVLKERITGKVRGGKSSADKVSFQIRQALGSSYRDPITHKLEHIDRCWVVSSREIKDGARESISVSLEVALSRVVEWIDGDTLWKLIETFLKPRLLLKNLSDAHETLIQASPDHQLIATVGGAQPQFTYRWKHSLEGEGEPSFTPLLHFPDSPEGAEAKKEYETHLKTGKPIILAKRFVDDLGLPAPLKPLFDLKDEYWGAVVIGPLNSGRNLQFDITLENEHGVCILPALDMQVLHAGSEEATLSNENQQHPCQFLVVIDTAAMHISLSMSVRWHAVNVKRQVEAARFQHAMSQGGIIRFLDVETGQPFVGGMIPQGAFPPVEDLYLLLLERLLAIQKESGKLFSLPEAVTSTEIAEVFELEEALRTGELQMANGKLVLPVPREQAYDLLEAFTKEEGASLGLLSKEEKERTLFGVTIPMGRAFAFIEQAFIPADEATRLCELLEQTPTRRTWRVPIQAAPTASAALVYERWVRDPEKKQFFEQQSDKS